jgi:hypothetical protein
MLWWWLVPIAVGLTVLPHVIALLIVGIAPSRGNMVCKVLRECSQRDRSVSNLPERGSSGCSHCGAPVTRGASAQQRNRRHRSREQSIPEDTA